MAREGDMRQRVLILWLALLAPCLWAQPAAADKAERAAIQRAKNVLVSSLDRSLPKVSLEFFLKSEGEGAPIHWGVKDCDEQTANPVPDNTKDPHICVEADVDLKDRRSVTVLVSVGIKRGSIGIPALVSVTTTDPKWNGPSRTSLGRRAHGSASSAGQASQRPGGSCGRDSFPSSIQLESLA
jgi:hypothetical protein